MTLSKLKIQDDLEQRISKATAEDGFFPGCGPEKAIDGKQESVDHLFSSKEAKYPWLSLHIGNKPWRVM